MSYTNPEGQPQGTAYQFTNRLREILISEVMAINAYQSQIADSEIEEINAVLRSIMLDEKDHFGWILDLLRKYDPEQCQQYIMHKADNPGPKTPMDNRNPNPGFQLALNNLREDIKGEMEAVILYEEILCKFAQRDIQNTLKTIIMNEKGHSEHLVRLLLKYDPNSYDNLT